MVMTIISGKWWKTQYEFITHHQLIYWNRSKHVTAIVKKMSSQLIYIYWDRERETEISDREDKQTEQKGEGDRNIEAEMQQMCNMIFCNKNWVLFMSVRFLLSGEAFSLLIDLVKQCNE